MSKYIDMWVKFLPTEEARDKQWMREAKGLELEEENTVSVVSTKGPTANDTPGELDSRPWLLNVIPLSKETGLAGVTLE